MLPDDMGVGPAPEEAMGEDLTGSATATVGDPIKGSLCIVHVATGQVMHSFRQGNKSDDVMWSQATEHKATYFPTDSYTVEDRVMSKTAAAREKSGFYIKVLFEGETEPIVIGHRYLREDKAQDAMDTKYKGMPGVKECEIVPASEALL